MAAPIDPGSYKEVMLFLGTAGVVVPLFSLIRVSPVLGFIGAGALLGPFGLGRFGAEVAWLRPFTIANVDQVAHIAEFGVVFLLFTIGLELSWERLRRLRRLVFGLGGAQVAACAVGLAGLGVGIGLRPVEALVGGLALALSSTAIVVPILAAKKRLNSPTGRATFAVLLFQDLAVAPVLFTISAVDGAGRGGLLSGLLLVLAQAAAALVVIVVAGRLVLRPLFQLVARTRSPELFMATCLLVVLGTGLLAAASGLSMALGAFLAGLLLAETEYRRSIEATVEPFKGLLLGVFFLSIGMGLDVTAIADAPVLIALAAAGTLLLKAGITAALALLFGQPLKVAVETGLLLGSGGEFAFVLIGAALAAGLLPDTVGQQFLLLTTVSMVMIPAVARIARGVSLRVESARAPVIRPEPPPAEASGHVVIAGFGRVGLLVAEMLERHGVPYIASDTNPALVAAQRNAGKPIYLGDATSPPFLLACGLDSARALVITLDAPGAVAAIVEAVRPNRPDLTIVARARDDRHARTLYGLGVTDAVPETIEASLQLSEAVLVDIGIAAGPVIASIHERRDEFRRLFQAASDGAAARPAREIRAFGGRRTAGRR